MTIRLPWYVYLICVVVMIASVFAGVDLNQRMAARSYINGSIDYRNQFSMKSFTYGNTSVVFYHDEYDTIGRYYQQLNLLKVDDFNGVEKKYQIVFNDYVILDNVIEAGSIVSTFDMKFYNTDGSLKVNATLVIKLEFYSNHTALLIETTGSAAAAQFEQYFTDKGIRLKVKELANE